jgi:uncharacterized membrane protein
VFALPHSLPRRIALVALAVFFVGAGVSHFTRTSFFLSIMPPYLPAHLGMVYLSGVFEILGGLLALPLATRRLAGYGLVILLLAVYPANIHMAANPEFFSDVPPWALYARLPLQFVFVAWAWWATAPDLRTETAS